MQNNPDDIIDQDELPSKTQRKQEMHALQKIGEQLVELDLKKLTVLDLPELLMDAVLHAKQIHKHGARRRQFQYIGKVMRKIDVLPIQAQLDAWRHVPVQQIARLHRLERWRERLLTDEHALTEFAQKFPAADLQHLRLLIRHTHKERLANKPPKNFRLLFQALQEIVTEVSE